MHPSSCPLHTCIFSIKTVLLALALVTWHIMWGTQGACCWCHSPPRCLPCLPPSFPAHYSNPGWAHGGPCFKYTQGGRGRLKMTRVISEAISRTAPAAGQYTSCQNKNIPPLLIQLPAAELSFSHHSGRHFYRVKTTQSSHDSYFVCTKVKLVHLSPFFPRPLPPFMLWKTALR